MRKFFDAIYNAAGFVAALFMVSILVCVILLIVARQFGWHLPGLNAYAGYSMAAAGFLSLAHTFRHNEHIRVTLLLNALAKGPRHYLNLLALIIATLIAANLAWYSVNLVLDSYAFNDLSTDEDATPLWIPQLGMAVGCVIFAFALAEELVYTFRGKSTLKPEDAASGHE